MTTSTSIRERRDWTLLIFIIPIGIILMLIAGQVAIRLVPTWSINAGMQSKLDPNNLPNQQNGLVQPVLPAILTPLGWLDTFLTPGAGSGNQSIIFAPFVVFQPTATPAVTLPPPTVVVTTTKPPTVTVTATASPTVVVTQPPATQKPPVDEPPIPPTTPPTVVPPPTVVVPPVVVVPPPAGVNIGTPDGAIYNLSDNSSLVIDLGSNPIVVNGSSDTNYDMVYYERLNCSGVCMDQVIIGISTFPDGSVYYTVFNWGDGISDTNSNVRDVDGVPVTENESDNQDIATTYLYGTPPRVTGIAIDVDNTLLSAPPIGSYRFLVIQAPNTGVNDGVDLDSVQVIELLNPSMVIASTSSVAEASAESVVAETLIEPVVAEAPAEPVEVEAPVEPVVAEAPAEPVEVVEAPAEPVEVEAPAEPVVVEAPAEPAPVEAPAQPAVP